MSQRVATLSIHMSLVLLLAGSLAVREATADSPRDVQDEAAPSLGLVTSTSGVAIDSDELRSPVSTFAYFSGQRIATAPDTRLVLTLQDGSVALDPDSAVVVTGTRGDYRVALEKGMMSLRFGAAADFEIAADDVLLRRSARSADGILEASFHLHDSGVLDVASHRGLLEAASGTDTPTVLEPGEPVRLGVAGAPLRLADVAAGDGEPGLLLRTVYATGGLAVFAGVTGLAVGLSDDDDDDSVASPTN